jgi:hypothetical protein
MGQDTNREAVSARTRAQDAIDVAPSGLLPVTLIAFADPPLPGRCLPALLEGYTAEWAAGLYAAMLRDTLDGLQSIDGAEHWVLASCDDAEGRSALERHLPAPWRLAQGAIAPRAELVVLARSEAPAARIDELVALLEARDGPIAAVGRAGEAWLVATSADLVSEPIGSSDVMAIAEAALRARSSSPELIVHELAPAQGVRTASDVVALLEELRRHPERAPRTAQYLVTRS